MKFPRFKVAKQVGLNPVAQAVARQQLMKYLRDAQIALHMADEGENWNELAVDLGRMFTVILCAMDHEGRANEPLCDDISRGLQAFVVISQNGFIRAWLPAIVKAIDAAVQLAPTLKPGSLNHGWKLTT